MRVARLIAVVTVGALLSACGSGGSAVAPGTPTYATNSSQQPSNALSVGPRQITPEYQPSPTPNEELLILVNTCNAEPNGQCANHTSTIQRYALSTGAALPTIQLQTSTCGGGGAGQMVATAGDRYFISAELNSNCQGQLEADGVDGSRSYLQPQASNLLVSSDLTTVLATGYQTTTVYRAPFQVESRLSTLYGMGTNSNGSVVFEPGTSGEQMNLAIESLVSGQTTMVSWSRGTGGMSPYGPAVYDARHAWVYMLASNGLTNRLYFVDTGHDKYLGYLNLPGQPLGVDNNATFYPAITIDPMNSDVYVLIGSKAYVYNVPACGCIAPRRVLAMPTTPQGPDDIVIDTNGQHLIAWYPYAQPTANMYDINPQTGALQRTYTITRNPPVYPTVVTVLAQ